jgi:ABC-type Na+ efflux pump permease subunit
LTLLGIARLRKWNPSGEPIQQRETAEDVEGEIVASKRRDIHAAPGTVRQVWPNPILWREIMTRAYGRKPLLIKAAYLLVVVLICTWVYQNLPTGHADRLLPAVGLVPVTVLGLLLLNAQSVTSITNERDLKALELLLVTDLTPREFLFGKLGGVFYNTVVIVLPPLLMAIAYAWLGYVGWESLLYLLVGLLVLMAFTAVLGLHVSLRHDNSRLAIGYSLGTVFFLFIGSMVCIAIILVSGGFGVQWTSFILFTVIAIGGMLFVLGGDHPSAAIGVASVACPSAVIYLILSVLIGNPQTGEAGDPLIPFVFLIAAFAFTIAAMLVPLLSEFEVKLAYSGPAEE